MNLREFIDQSGTTKYRISKRSGIPYGTLNDLYKGKTQITKCSGETLYRLAKTLQLPIEALLEQSMQEILMSEKSKCKE